MKKINWKDKKQVKEYFVRTKKSKREHPKETKARKKSQHKIKIPRGQICENCNKNLAIHRHHKDYSKPLEIKFLCMGCHRKIHYPQ